MESLFIIGDVVTIKSEYDEGMGGKDYPFIFTEHMRTAYGGYTYTIREVYKAGDGEYKYTKAYNEDDYVYKLKGNSWNWHSSMFVEKNKIPTKAINIF